MALYTRYGGWRNIAGPIRECIKVVARAGAAQMMCVIRCFLTDTGADPGRPRVRLMAFLPSLMCCSVVLRSLKKDVVISETG